MSGCHCHARPVREADEVVDFDIDYCTLHQAAPHLLEACEATLVDLRVARILSEKGFENTIKRLEAAIARATEAQ